MLCRRSDERRSRSSNRAGSSARAPERIARRSTRAGRVRSTVGRNTPRKTSWTAPSTCDPEPSGNARNVSASGSVWPEPFRSSSHTGSPAADRAGDGRVGVERERTEIDATEVTVARDDVERGPLRPVRARRRRRPHRPLLGCARCRPAHLRRRCCSRERSRHLVEPAGFERTPCSLGLGSAALDLLERQPRLVGEPADEDERRGVRPRDHRLPGDDQDQLRLSRDHDRDAKRRADTEPSDSDKALAKRLLADVGHEGHVERVNSVAQPREVVEVGLEAGRGEVRSPGRTRSTPAIPLDAPEHRDVGAEDGPRLATDRVGHHRLAPSEEPRRDAEDPVEASSRLQLRSYSRARSSA